MYLASNNWSWLIRRPRTSFNRRWRTIPSILFVGSAQIRCLSQCIINLSQNQHKRCYEAVVSVCLKPWRFRWCPEWLWPLRPLKTRSYKEDTHFPSIYWSIAIISRNNNFQDAQSHTKLQSAHIQMPMVHISFDFELPLRIPSILLPF